MGKDRRPDRVDVVPARSPQLSSFERAGAELVEFRAPTLWDASEPLSRLFVASFDGTGNSRRKDASENQTNVAGVATQIEESANPNVVAGYVEGVGTQDNFARRASDLATGHTFNARIEDMYVQFCEAVHAWKRDHPDADIKLMVTGFSRGAEQAAAFTRLVHERGILNPDDARIFEDQDGLRRLVSSPQPPLVPPGATAQSIVLFDPVPTFEPRQHDRRLPSSVMSALQVTSIDEKRDQFYGTDYFDLGISENGRFVHVRVHGVHSSIGGGYA